MSLTRILCPDCGFPQPFCACGKHGAPGEGAPSESAGPSGSLRCDGVVGNGVRAHVTACGTYMVIDLPNFACGLSLDFRTAYALHQAIGGQLSEMAQPDPNKQMSNSDPEKTS